MNPEKLSNDQRSIKVLCKPSMRIEEPAKTVGTSDFEVIIVKASTENAGDKTHKELIGATPNTLDNVQKNKPALLSSNEATITVSMP